MTDNKLPIISVIGGCGRVGLPFGVALACAGFETRLIDADEKAVKTVHSGKFPFLESNGDRYLKSALERKLLRASSKPEDCRGADVFVFVAGTPVDEHLNPSVSNVSAVFDEYERLLSPGKLVLMRSALFPGTMQFLRARLERTMPGALLAFAPERVAQGAALEEIGTLPQLLAAFDGESFEAARGVLSRVAPALVRLEPLEAEMAALMHNAWRYLQFAIGNQFYMIAEKNGVDFLKLFETICYKYPRAAGYTRPGLVAGPALLNQTMQLASYLEHRFDLGHAAMLVNEGLAELLVEKTKLALGGDLWGKTVGLLGLSFKPNSDDFRESLSFRIKKGLEFWGATVLCHDPHFKESAPLETILKNSAAIVLATPHSAYKDLAIKQPLIDVWDFYRRAKVDALPGRR